MQNALMWQSSSWGYAARMPDVAARWEDSSRTGLDLTGRRIFDSRRRGSRKTDIVVNISVVGRAWNWANRLCPAIIQAFFPGMLGGDALRTCFLRFTIPAAN